MSEENPIRIFVSHVFVESDDYLRVFEYLESVDRFYYLNVSDPETTPSGGAEGFKQALKDQIKAAEALIVLATVHAEKPDWIDFQINAAKAMDKPVVLLNSFGGATMVPGDLLSRADEVVDWNARELADALRKQARHEDTHRWDVIDFP